MEIKNRAGLAAIAYRVGTYATFRQAMLSAIAGTGVRNEAGGTTRPLTGWTARQSDDFGIALCEMWAYVADILTFYQERTANEAYLGTATLRASLARLARLIGYRPDPGKAASAYLAFILEKNKSLTIEPQLRVQSVPGEGETAQKFETVETITANALLNSFRVYGAPERYAPLTAGANEVTVLGATLVGATSPLAPGDQLVIFTPSVDGKSKMMVSPDRSESERVVPTERPSVSVTTPAAPVRFSYGTQRGMLDVEDKQVTAVESVGWRTVVRWQPPVGRDFGARTVVQKWQRKLGLFGRNAPASSFSVSVDAYSNVTWSQPSFDYSPEGKTLQLDGVYDDLKPNTALLLVARLSGGNPSIRQYTAVAVEQVHMSTSSASGTLPGASAPGMEATVTSVTLDDDLPEGIDVRTAVVYELTGDPLELWQQKYPETVSGNAVYVPLAELKNALGIQLTGAEAQALFTVGQRMILEDGSGQAQAGTVTTTQVSAGHLKITLTSALSPSLDASTAQARANVALATHGETVAGGSVPQEVLGSGDRSLVFQSFSLRKAPVTYIAQAGARHGAASTLAVRADDILWQEVETLYGQGADARVYTTSVDDDGVMTVQFGDGQTGSRLPTGKDNLVASYRQGIGEAGNADAGALSVPLDKPVGLKTVINPLAAEGGADPETASQLRRNAPNTVRTLGRIVSLRDFEDAAREYSGIAKASAAWKWDGMEQVVCLTVAGEGGATVPAGSLTYKNLLADLNSRRDPYRRLVIESFRPVPVQVYARIGIVEGYDGATVQAAALAALESHFDFDALDLGVPVHLSDVMRVLQDVEGVEAVDVDRLQFRDAADRTSHNVTADAVQAHLPVFQNELPQVASSTDLRVSIGLSQR